MQDDEKTKEQLIDELRELRSRVGEFESDKAKFLGTEKALTESEGQKQAILDGITSNIVFVHEDMKIRWANKTAADSVGKLPSQMIGKKCHTLWADSDKPCDGCPTIKAFKTKKSEQITMVTPDGRVWEEKGEPVFDAQGSLIGVVEIARDITERKLAEEAAREIGERYRQLVEYANDIIFQTNEGGFFTFVNPVALQLTGYTEKEILGKHYTELILPDYREKATRFYGRQFVKRLPVTYNEFPLVTKHDMTLWIGQNTQLLMDGETVVGFQSIARDITERKRMEEELRTSEDKFSKAFFLSPDAISISRLIDGTIMSVNEGFKQIFGYAEAEVIGKTSLELNIWDKPEHRNRWIEKLKAEGIVDNFETRFRTKDGDIRYGLMSASITVLNGVEHILNVTRDITDRKQAEEALKAEKQRFQSLGENSPFGMVMIQPDGTFSYANPKFKEMFGYDLGDVPNGREWFRKAYPDPHYRHEVISSWMEHVKSSAPGETTPRVFRVTCKDGTEKIVHFRPVKLDSDEYMMTCEDITALNKAEEALRASEELYRNFFETSHECVFITTPDGKFIDVNPAGMEMFGYDPQDKEKLRLMGVASSYANPEERQDHARVVSERGFSKDYPVDFRKQDGTLFNALVTTICNKDEHGNVIGFSGTIRDITERKRWEQELQNTLRRFYTILSASYAGVLLVTNEDTVEFVNQAMCDLFDIEDSPDRLQGISASEMIEKLKNAYEQPSETLDRIRQIVSQGMQVKGEEVAVRGGRTYLVDLIPIEIDNKPYGRLW
ncbi:MAG: PAS domain S-box protein, partial [Desulfomonile sp.]